MNEQLLEARKRAIQEKSDSLPSSDYWSNLGTTAADINNAMGSGDYKKGKELAEGKDVAVLGGTTDMESADVQDIQSARNALEDTASIDTGEGLDMGAIGGIAKGFSKAGSSPEIKAMKMQNIDAGQPSAEGQEYEARKRALMQMVGRQ